MKNYGVKNIIGFDSRGIFTRKNGDNSENSIWLEKNLNPNNEKGDLSKILEGADFFLGLAGPDLVTKNQLKNMKKNSIVFALSNPNPEIMPEDIPSNISIIATGRSDYPNQVNNSLAYPGFFRGLVDSRAKKITVEMEIAASKALSSVIDKENLSEDFIMPSMFDGNVVKKISDSISSIVDEQNLSRKKISNTGYNSFKRFH